MDIYTRDWIIEKSRQVLQGYSSGITVRQLHYRLVAEHGMTNDMNHYKRVVAAMTKARWDGIVSMDSFIDRERTTYWETKDQVKDLDDEIETGKRQIRAWMRAYHLNRWSNQENYIEVWIEKKALQGVFEDPCMNNDVRLAPCKGYPSITFLNEAAPRFERALDSGRRAIMLYFGDYDPSGCNIPESIVENLYNMGVDVELKRIALNPEQIKKLNLPSVPPKRTDSRTKSWNGDGVVELDAIEPKLLAKMCNEAINKYFDTDLYAELKELEEEERAKYQEQLKKYVEEL